MVGGELANMRGVVAKIRNNACRSRRFLADHALSQIAAIRDLLMLDAEGSGVLTGAN